MLTRRESQLTPQSVSLNPIQNPPMKEVVSTSEEAKKQVKQAGQIISDEAKELVDGYIANEKKISQEGGSAKYKVGSTLSSLAFFYERVRNSIEYKQDHIQLRASIERIIKRLLWENPSRAFNTKSLSEALVKELIWARYIKNSEIPEKRIGEISEILDRSLSFLSSVSYTKRKIGSSSMRDYILGITSGEIEELLKPRLKINDLLTEVVVKWFTKRFVWKNGTDEIDKKIHIWAGVYRSLFKADLPSLRFHLIKRFYPTWVKANKSSVRQITDEFIILASNMEKIITSDKHVRVLRAIQKITPSFQILLEIITRGNANALNDKKALSSLIAEYCERKYQEIGSRVRTGITRSVIYIFATKIIFAVILEVPYEIFILNGLRWIPVAINLTLPPLLMVFVGLLIRRPGGENTKRIEEWVFDFVYQEKDDKIDFVVNEKKNRGAAYKIFSVFYLLFFISLFGSVSYLLYILDFSIVSAFIFFSFVSLVLLFGYKVKNTSSEFNVSSDDEGIVGNVASVFFLPFLNVGSWLSSKVSKLNVLMLILDFLIEAPLKNILAILQDWTAFMKEKKDEFVDVPNN